MKIEWKSERQNCLIIYVDGEKWREADPTILGKKPDLPCDCPSITALEKLFNALEYRGALHYAYKRIALKNYSTFELKTLLDKKQVSEVNCQKIVEELVSKGYLNDDEWVDGFIRHQKRKLNGPRAILYKLKEKGCQDASAMQSLFDPEMQQEALLKLLQKKYSQINYEDKYERGKVIAALMRKGFDLNSIRSALNLFSHSE